MADNMLSNMYNMLINFLLLGCTASNTKFEDTSVFVPSENNEIPTSDLHGSVPASAVALPDFNASNYDGAARSREDLQGHPSVIWFYPAAATAG